MKLFSDLIYFVSSIFLCFQVLETSHLLTDWLTERPNMVFAMLVSAFICLSVLCPGIHNHEASCESSMTEQMLELQERLICLENAMEVLTETQSTGNRHRGRNM